MSLEEKSDMSYSVYCFKQWYGRMWEINKKGMKLIADKDAAEKFVTVFNEKSLAWTDFNTDESGL